MRFVKTAESILNIPSGFTRVEYLENTGSTSSTVQYIDTGVKWVGDNHKISIGFFKDDITTASQTAVCGVQGGTSNNEVFAIYYGNLYVYGGNGDTTGRTKNGVWLGNVYNNFDITLNNDTVSFVLNGNPVNSYTARTNYVDIDKTMYLFRNNNSTFQCLTGKIYYCKIWDNDVLVRDMIPCIDPLGRACMYDLVGKKAYYNQGTGEFTVGRQIIPVDYLESTGTQYIDTGITGNNNIKIQTKIYPTVINKFIFGSRSSSTINAFGLFVHSNDGGSWYPFFDNGKAMIPGFAINNDYTIEFSKDGLVVNGTLLQGPYDNTFTNALTMKLFAMDTNGTVDNRMFIGKMDYCKIYENSALVRDFVPCKDENNVGFMFDTVSGTVYENAGTGAFTVGDNKYKMKLRLIRDNILPTGYTQVEYLENTGTASTRNWINTGIVPDTTTRWEVRILFNNTTTGKLMGSGYTNPTRFNIGIESNKFRFAFNTWFDANSNITTPDTDAHTWIMDAPSKTFTIDEYSVTTTQTFGESIFPICLFGRCNSASGNTETTSVVIGKIYYSKIWQNNILVRNLIPAIDPSGVPCMYDLVSKTPFYNQGTGTFTTGKPVLPIVRFPVDPDPVGYKIVNYLESTSTQYIDTGFKPNPATTKIDCAFCGFSGGSTQMFGVRTVSASNNENNTNICFGPLGGKIYIRGDWIRQTKNLVTDIEPEEYIHLIAHNQTVSINGTEYSYTLEKNNTYLDYNFYLFACNTAGNIQFYSKIRQYYFKIYDNNTLVRSFIPVIRLLDNKAGMWDTVTKQFYTTPVGDFITG